jgi:hypothetical protein
MLIFLCSQRQHNRKDKNLHIRLSEKRLNKLRTIAVSREKTITQMVEEWIDRLSDKSID